MYYVRPEEF